MSAGMYKDKIIALHCSHKNSFTVTKIRHNLIVYCNNNIITEKHITL